MNEISVLVPAEVTDYRLIIGSNLFPDIAGEIKENYPGYRVSIITESTVGPLWSEKLVASLGDRPVSVFTFPAGEAHKTRATKEALEDQMLQAGLTRNTLVLALGGGVTGDVAGFVAATYMRGVPVIQIPTTTLAMADASIGGKTAVDTPFGKNLIGAFHQPKAVYMDMTLLATLDERNYVAGLAEVAKHGFIQDPAILDFLALERESIRRRDPKTLETLFTLNCHVKNEVVSQDPTEKGLRKILNYGHTLGHAVEMATLNSDHPLLHGECVAIGMVFAARLAAEKEMCQPSVIEKTAEVLQNLDLSITVPEGLTVETLLPYMKRDKKSQNGQMKFVLPSGIGKVVYDVPIQEEDIRRIWG